jgi:hypothetical protein
VISEPAPFYTGKYRKTMHSLERYHIDDQARSIPTHEDYHLQPLLRVRSLKAIDHRTLSAPSSPVLQPRYRSYERSNHRYQQQSSNHQGYQDNYQSSISKSASMPNGGFPVQTPMVAAPLPMSPYGSSSYQQQQPRMYRERVIDRHVAERSTSRGESHRQQHQDVNGNVHLRSTSSNGPSSTLNRSIPVRYETDRASSYRQSNGYRHDQTQQQGNNYRQQVHVSSHPTRVVH